MTKKGMSMKDLNAELAAGRGIISNCNAGFGIKFSETGDGRVAIEVDPTPAHAEWPLVAAFMEETAVEWLKQVAPHRLALGADERHTTPATL